MTLCTHSVHWSTSESRQSQHSLRQYIVCTDFLWFEFPRLRLQSQNHALSQSEHISLPSKMKIIPGVRLEPRKQNLWCYFPYYYVESPTSRLSRAQAFPRNHSQRVPWPDIAASRMQHCSHCVKRFHEICYFVTRMKVLSAWWLYLNFQCTELYQKA